MQIMEGRPWLLYYKWVHYFIGNEMPLKSFKHEINKIKFVFKKTYSASRMKIGFFARMKSKRFVVFEVIC